MCSPAELWRTARWHRPLRLTALDGEIVSERATIDHTRGLTDRIGKVKRRSHPVDLAECLLEVPLFGVPRPKALVPDSESLEFLSLAITQCVPGRVFVPPADHCRESLIVERIRYRGADARLLCSLAFGERSPFGSSVES